MLKCWIYDEKRRPSFSELLQEIEDFLSHPKTITAEVAMIDISVPLLNRSSPARVQAPPSLDEFLDRAKLGHYRRSFHAQGIDSIQSLSNITVRYAFKYVLNLLTNVYTAENDANLFNSSYT